MSAKLLQGEPDMTLLTAQAVYCGPSMKFSKKILLFSPDPSAGYCFQTFALK